MPLTIRGKEVLSDFKIRYGIKKGKELFYAWLKKYPKISGLHN